MEDFEPPVSKWTASNVAKIFGILSGICFGLLIVARIFGWFAPYNTPTPANEPNLNVGGYMVVSNLVAPTSGDFIVFLHTLEAVNEGKETIWVMRLCGLEGDTIQIIDGVCFRNGIDFDAHRNLSLEHHLTFEQYKAYFHLQAVPTEHSGRVIREGWKQAYFTREVSDSLGIAEQEFILPDSLLQPYDNMYFPDWNQDQFGPYVVPEGHYFVLGDNRHAAADSRYIGPIPIEKFQGTIIGVW